MCIGVNLAKYWEGPSQSRVGVGMEGDWIGFGVRLCLEWSMKTVGQEKAEFSQIRKWTLYMDK